MIGSRLAYGDNDPRPRRYRGDPNEERWRQDDSQRKRDEKMYRDYDEWEQRQRFRPTTPRWWHDDDPRPPRQHDVPPARPGNLWGRW
jgi:hypothetical protein